MKEQGPRIFLFLSQTHDYIAAPVAVNYLENSSYGNTRQAQQK